MDFYEAVEARRSVRSYVSDPVSREIVDRILNAGRMAPSWKNRQCWRYILISDPSLRRALGELIENPSADCYINAPYALVLCAEPSDSGMQQGKEYYMADCAASLQQVMLAAACEGLGTCFVGFFMEKPVHKLLGIPDEVRIVAISPLGVPADTPKQKQRRPLQDTVMENRWRA